MISRNTPRASDTDSEHHGLLHYSGQIAIGQGSFTDGQRNRFLPGVCFLTLTSPIPTLRQTRKTESPGSYLGQTKERPVIPHKILMEPAPQAARVRGQPEGKALPGRRQQCLVWWSGQRLFSRKTGARVAYMPVTRFKNADLPFSKLEVRI